MGNANGQYGNIGETRRGLLIFVSQLKTGKGLTLAARPDQWSSPLGNPDAEATHFSNIIRTIVAADCSTLVPKNVNEYPALAEKLYGTIDVYWVVLGLHDGGLLMLLPFLLHKHKTWRNTTEVVYS